MDLTCYKQRWRQSGLRPPVNLEENTNFLIQDAWLQIHPHGLCSILRSERVLFSELDRNTYDNLYFLSKAEADKL